MAKSADKTLLTWEGRTSDGTNSWSVQGTRGHFEELLASLQSFLKGGE